MTELFQVLYNYALQSQLSYNQEDYLQYLASTKCVERILKKLHERLDADGIKMLESLLEEQCILHDLEMEAIFCAGLSIGQEISRL